MLRALRRFFDQHIAPRDDTSAPSTEQQVRLAAAALLVEAMRSDAQFSDVEREAVLASVQRKFALEPERARELLALAEAASHEAHDLFQFTSRINASFPPERKERLIEELWRVAYADEVLHAHEEHLIRRVADLLHVRHSDFIAAKVRVLEDGGRDADDGTRRRQS